MIPENIIKAMEYCVGQGITSECEGCKYKKGCRPDLIVDALALIKRLKAKNKELDEKIVIQMGTIDWQAKEINRQKAESERLNVEVAGMRGAAESYKIHYDKAQKKIKALKEELDGETVENMRLGHEVERLKWDLAFREKQLDNLVKEMEGADK